MGKYLKQSFVMKLERQLSRGEITHSFMVDSMQGECIKNYIAETSNNKRKMKFGHSEIYGQYYIFPTIKVTHDRLLNGDKEIILCWLKWEWILGW